MPDVFSVAEILVRHALQAHPGEIAMIAFYGSHATGAAAPTSDLDLFYIPDEGKARSLSSQFVLDGLPYDFWPVSWSFLEDIAEARSGRPWAVAASLVEAGFHPTAFNLLGEISAGYRAAGFPDLLEPAARGDLDTLAERVQQLDRAVRRWLQSHDIDLNVLGGEDDLRRFLNERDPLAS